MIALEDGDYLISLNQAIYHCLNELGFQANLFGRCYIHAALLEILTNPSPKPPIYPFLIDKFQINYSRLEKRIRYAITRAARNPTTLWKELFLNEQPAVLFCIYTIVIYIKYNYLGGDET